MSLLLLSLLGRHGVLGALSLPSNERPQPYLTDRVHTRTLLQVPIPQSPAVSVGTLSATSLAFAPLTAGAPAAISLGFTNSLAMAGGDSVRAGVGNTYLQFH